MNETFTFASSDGKKFSCSIPSCLFHDPNKPIDNVILDRYAAKDRDPAHIIASQKAKVGSMFNAFLAGKGPLTWEGHKVEFKEVPQEKSMQSLPANAEAVRGTFTA